MQTNLLQGKEWVIPGQQWSSENKSWARRSSIINVPHKWFSNFVSWIWLSGEIKHESVFLFLPFKLFLLIINSYLFVIVKCLQYWHFAFEQTNLRVYTHLLLVSKITSHWQSTTFFQCSFADFGKVNPDRVGNLKTSFLTTTPFDFFPTLLMTST